MAFFRTAATGDVNKQHVFLGVRSRVKSPLCRSCSHLLSIFFVGFHLSAHALQAAASAPRLLQHGAKAAARTHQSAAASMVGASVTTAPGPPAPPALPAAPHPQSQNLSFLANASSLANRTAAQERLPRFGTATPEHSDNERDPGVDLVDALELTKNRVSLSDISTAASTPAASRRGSSTPRSSSAASTPRSSLRRSSSNASSASGGAWFADYHTGSRVSFDKRSRLVQALQGIADQEQDQEQDVSPSSVSQRGTPRSWEQFQASRDSGPSAQPPSEQVGGESETSLAERLSRMQLDTGQRPEEDVRVTQVQARKMKSGTKYASAPAAGSDVSTAPAAPNAPATAIAAAAAEVLEKTARHQTMREQPVTSTGGSGSPSSSHEDVAQQTSEAAAAPYLRTLSRTTSLPVTASERSSLIASTASAASSSTAASGTTPRGGSSSSLLSSRRSTGSSSSPPYTSPKRVSWAPEASLVSMHPDPDLEEFTILPIKFDAERGLRKHTSALGMMCSDDVFDSGSQEAVQCESFVEDLLRELADIEREQRKWNLPPSKERGLQERTRLVVEKLESMCGRLHCLGEKADSESDSAAEMLSSLIIRSSAPAQIRQKQYKDLQEAITDKRIVASSLMKLEKKVKGIIAMKKQPVLCLAKKLAGHAANAAMAKIRKEFNAATSNIGKPS